MLARIQSRPGKRILWRTISPIMHPTDHISTAGTEGRSEKEGCGKEERPEVSIDRNRGDSYLIMAEKQQLVKQI